MAKLKIEALSDDKPVKVNVELPPSVHRDLIAYADVVGRQSGQTIVDPAKLMVAMLTRFMATDREFKRSRKSSQAAGRNG
jgi:hypothetical protein